MENNEALSQLSAKIDGLYAKIDNINAKLSRIEVILSENTTKLNATGAQKGNNIDLLSATGVQNSANLELNNKLFLLLQKEVRKEGKLDFRESVPSQLTRIMCYIRDRKNASSGDIRLQFRLGEPTYRRYITFLRKWNWIELTPGAKKGNFILSQKGKELMDRISST
jgi:hypothetical protein